MICPTCKNPFEPGKSRRSVYCSVACHKHRLRDPARFVEAFWEKVDKRGPDECWLWKGAKQRAGYGHFRTPEGKTITSSRFAWVLANGAIPDGMHALHRCDNRACVNPAHIFLGSHTQNMADCKAKGRHTKGEQTKRNKITERQARDVLAQKGRAKADELAHTLGVTPGAIHAIWRGDAWSHINEQ